VVLREISRVKGGDWTGWLGREDSNHRMVESKSTYFASEINAHSEKIANFTKSDAV
jgi:hypothetical protein